jgi:c-di-AMP phosphodiesterase-like protein
MQAIATKEFHDNKPIICELEIDNIQRLSSSLSEEEVFNNQHKIIKTLDKLVDKYEILFRRYSIGKYIIFTNQETIEK